MTERRFAQVDVFTDVPCLGNPVAVVLDGEGLSAAEMQRFANWTNLSETTFVVSPRGEGADYGVRIFTPSRELPFAGHPTLGTCHAWVESGGVPRTPGLIVQECEAGLIPIRHTGMYSFASPPLIRSGPVAADLLGKVVAQLAIDASQVVDAAWVDNGPGWIGVLMASDDEVLGVVPGDVDEDITIIGPAAGGAGHAFEVRAFFPKDGGTAEDPVTGSANASLAEWLVAGGRATPPYTTRQGTALGRAGIVHIDRDGDGQIWVGGGTVTCVSGSVAL